MRDTMKRILALVLCFAMLASFMPGFIFSAEAEGTVVDAAVMFSDLHTKKSDYKESTLKGVLNAMKNAGIDATSVTSCGDAFSVNEDSSSSNGPYTGYTATLNGYIHAVYTGVDINYVWSDHDRYAVQEDGTTLLDKKSQLVYGAGEDGVYGTEDDGNYYVYALSMGDLCSYDRYKAGFNYTENGSRAESTGFTSTVPVAIEAFKSAVAELDQSKPLFIASHQPLFDNRNDNAWAEEWFDAINEVAENMDVAFFYGHNHKYDKSNEYYYAKGSEMPVATADKWGFDYDVGEGYLPSMDLSSESKTLNFTHMCAGYLAPSSTGSTSSTTREGTAVAITIYEDSIQYTTYNANGVYSGNYALNVNVPRDHAPEEAPEVPETTAPEATEPEVTEPESVELTDTATGVAVSASGMTGLTVSAVSKPAAVEDIFTGEVVAYDITPAGFVNGSGTATVKFPIPASMDAAKFAVYHINADGTAEQMTGSVSTDGKFYVFTTDSFSVFVGGQRSTTSTITGEYEVGTGNLAGSKTYTLDTNGVSEGEYLIVNTYNTSYWDDDVTGYALTNNNGSDGRTAVTITSSDTITVSDASNIAWTFAKSGNYYSITNNNYHPYPGNNSLSLTTDAVNFTVSDRGNGAYRVYRSASNYIYGLRYNSGWTGTRASNASSIYSVYLYELTSAVNGTSVTFKLQNPADMETEATKDLVYEITLGDGTVVNSATIEWESGNTDVATVSNGKVTTTTKGGTTNIYAKLTHVNGAALASPIELHVELHVQAPTVTFDVEPGSLSMIVNGTEKLTPTVTYNGVATENVTITWESSNEDVVTVDQNGNVTAVGAGSATITAKLTKANGKTVSMTENIAVTVSEKQAVGITVEPTVITVQRDTADTAEVGTIVVDYGDSGTVEVPLTLGMLQGNKDLTTNGIYEDLYVEYAGQKATGITLKVIDREGNNYPEYPDPGSVNVGKNADATYLQEYGIAKVELSTSGLPVETGVDVIVMLDLSSSMNRHIYCDEKSCSNSNCDKVTRLDALKSALATFEEQLDASPKKDNIRVAIADFNVFYSSNSPVAYDSSDYVEASFSASGTNKIYTGNEQIGAGAFESVDDLDVASFTFSVGSGTNYDYAFDTIYQLGSAIKAENKANGQENRELVVLFMSDGAANQFNFYRSSGNDKTGYTDDDPDYGWNFWLDGTMTDDDLKSTSNGGRLNSATHAYYYDSVDHDGDGKVNEHRMANAIKGDPNTKYEVIRKSNSVAGGVTLEAGSNTNLYLAPGLGATMYAIAFDIAHDGPIADEAIFASLEQVPTSDEYYVNATSQEDLVNAFKQFASDITYAATNAYYVDQLGDSFSLQMTTTVNKRNEAGEVVPTKLVDDKGNPVIVPKIQVLNYNIYKASDVGTTIGGVTVTAEMVGKRYGDAIVVEEITFTDDGKGNVTGVFSNLIDGGNTNILDAATNVITAKNFYYNTSGTVQTVDGIRLDPESFRWNIGTINNIEWALSYYVYLDGSMEGNTSSGSYKTNNYATLYYKNHLGNNAFQDTTSPQVGWKSANVSYAFYLVNAAGQPVVNQTTGQTGNFTNAVKITQPVVYDEIMLNNIENINTIEASSLDVLPVGYDLYDPAASYKIVILSEDGKGSWTITSGKTPQSTYVTGYAGAQSSNVAKISSVAMDDYTVETGYDYTHTTVWFAVVWVPKAIPDAVVVDYGLPVDISVMANDQFGLNGTLNGIGSTADMTAALTTDDGSLAEYTASHSENFGEALTATYGKADILGTKVRYTPTTMSWGSGSDAFDRFAYEVEYTYKFNDEGKYDENVADIQYYYGEVTVIPATTVYYEDEFVTLTTSTLLVDEKTGEPSLDENGDKQYSTAPGWTVDSKKASATQGEDRPGRYSSADIDKNQSYGYDAAYANMSTFSMGSAAMTTVNAGTYATAEFEFYGTGFDVISLTSNMTGTILVDIYTPDGNGGWTLSEYWDMVDTYYGYNRNDDGKWVLDESAENSLYQVPVIKMEGLPYGRYKAVITASYMEFMDHTAADGYDFYLDAIRIYNPAGDGIDVVYTDKNDTNKKTTIADIYNQDGEGWPRYQELRNIIIAAHDFDSRPDENGDTGAIFIDHTAGEYTISDYTNYGPNNELYLAKNQSVAFDLDLSHYIKDNNGGKRTIVADVQLGVKSATGENVKVTLSADGVSATREFATATDMYYSFVQLLDMGNDVNDGANDSKTTVVITNSGSSGIVSITNIKVTFKDNPAKYEEPVQPALLTVSRGTGERALMMLLDTSSNIQIPEETEPEVTEPEVTEPEVTEPEVTEPEVTEPEVTEPEVTEPEVTEPEVTEPKVTEPKETEPEVTEPEETEPEETEPEETEPEETEPEETEPEESEPEETEPEDTEPEQDSGKSRGLIGIIIDLIRKLFAWIFG